MPVGQSLNVVVCAASAPGVGAGQVAGPVAGFAGCPSGEDLYVVQSYVPLATSAGFLDPLALPFDGVQGSEFFSFGFGLVLMFYVLGRSLSAVVAPFWRGRL